jgi:Bacterial SH3 domain
MQKTQLMMTGLLLAGVMVVPAALAEDGGPDFYEVTGVKNIHHLNIRKSGSLKAAVLGGASNGEKLKNLGCDDGAEGRWCQVEATGGLKGYAFGRYLKEAAGIAAMAPKAPPAFALGTLKCERNNGSPVADCSYGVMRFPGGIAKLQVTWPDASKRTFGISATVATSKDGPVTIKTGSDGSLDLTITPAGSSSEHYVVPGDVITGAK